MAESKVTSPCISICKTDPITGYCYGCSRTNEEKQVWKDENTLNQWKLDNIESLQKRMQGWQLETFNQSYKFKKEKGMSLFKFNIEKKKSKLAK